MEDSRIADSKDAEAETVRLKAAALSTWAGWLVCGVAVGVSGAESVHRETGFVMASWVESELKTPEEPGQSETESTDICGESAEEGRTSVGDGNDLVVMVAPICDSGAVEGNDSQSQKPKRNWNCELD